MRTEKEIRNELAGLKYLKTNSNFACLPNNGLVLDTKINVLEWVLNASVGGKST